MPPLPSDDRPALATTEMAARAGWQHLEQAEAQLASGANADALAWAQAALAAFEQAGDGGGQAAASLCLGDAHAQGGRGGEALSWWARARSLADAVGATPLAARALLALALRELGAGDAAVADALLDAAEQRANLALPAPPSEDSTDAAAADSQRMSDAVRVGVTLVRAQQAIAAREGPRARLLLALAAEGAQGLGDLALYIDALRLDGCLACRSGDPRGAVQALERACEAASALGNLRVLDLLRSELVLALCDNESWAEAAELQQREVPEIVGDQPAWQAARLEGYAVLALRAAQPEAAVQALTQTLALRQGADQRVGALRTQILLARALLRAGQLDAARDNTARVAAAATAPGQHDLALEGATLGLLIDLAQWGTAATATIEQVQELSETAAGSVQQLAALDAAAAAWLQRGDAAKALNAADKAVAWAQQQPLLRLHARALARRAAAVAATQDVARALVLALEAAETADKAGDAPSRAMSLCTLGEALAAQGRLDEAILVLQHALGGAATSERRDIAAEIRFAQANLHATMHDWPQARIGFDACQSQAEALGMRSLALRAQRGVALCLLREGQDEQAQDLLEATFAVAQQANLRADLAGVAVDLAQVLVERGSTQQAQTLLGQLLDQPEHLTPLQRAEAHLLAGRLLAQARQPQPAAEHLREAVAVLRSCQAPRSLGAALLLLGQVEGMLDDGAACGTLLGEALVITAQHGLPEQQVVRRIIERMGAADSGR